MARAVAQKAAAEDAARLSQRKAPGAPGLKGDQLRQFRQQNKFYIRGGNFRVIFEQWHIRSAIIAIGFENIHASRGVIWRWFIFEGSDSSPVESGIILESDRDKAEAAAKQAIERLRRMQPSA